MEESDREDLGVLMVLLLVSVIMSAVGTAVLEMCTARRWVGIVTHAFKIRYEGKVQEERGVPVSVALRLQPLTSDFYFCHFLHLVLPVHRLVSREVRGRMERGRGSGIRRCRDSERGVCVPPAPYSTIRAACGRPRDRSLLL